jgi:hypothetical protein
MYTAKQRGGDGLEKPIQIVEGHVVMPEGGLPNGIYDIFVAGELAALAYFHVEEDEVVHAGNHRPTGEGYVYLNASDLADLFGAGTQQTLAGFLDATIATYEKTLSIVMGNPCPGCGEVHNPKIVKKDVLVATWPQIVEAFTQRADNLGALIQHGVMVTRCHCDAHDDTISLEVAGYEDEQHVVVTLSRILDILSFDIDAITAAE